MTTPRRFGRIPFATTLSLTHKDRTYQGSLQDIALKGALLHFDRLPPLQPNDICQLDIPLLNSDIVMHFSAEAIHFHQETIGFRFVEMGLETMSHLRRLLELNTGNAEKIEQEMAFLRKNEVAH